ncbi:MAG: Zn-ribbon domain-containing OB-fold protein [Candidatus Rokuibacteriota bacterium]
MSVDAPHACAFCGSERGAVTALSGGGRLVSWTVIRVAPGRYAAEVPYVVALIDLDEGGRITARVAGDGERLTAGQPVGLASVDSARGPIFQPR